MNNFDVSKFDEIRKNSEEYYKALGEIYCPYFQNKVVFNAKGLEHLKFNSKNHARLQSDQFTRFKLLHLAPEAIQLSRTVQGISHTKNFEFMRSNARTETILKDVSYYEFIAVLKDGQENKRIRVVIKQIDNGPRYFWSIIPFWKIDKWNHKRMMNSSHLETN